MSSRNWVSLEAAGSDDSVIYYGPRRPEIENLEILKKKRLQNLLQRRERKQAGYLANMTVDYAVADRIVEMSFGKLNQPNARMDFPAPGTLSRHFNRLLSGERAEAR